jgi:DNA-binding transcriptional LysR family regulator
METKHLKTFATICELESFTRASRRLGMSQSAISQQVSALERGLGVELLARKGTGARPTPAGEVLLQYTRQILAKMDEAERLLGDYDAEGAGRLRIGAGGAMCRFLLPRVLQEFHAAFPKVELQVSSGHTRLTVDRLVDGDLDVGLVALPVSHERIRLVDLGRDELVAIVARSHPWAAERRVQPRDFAGQPLLVYERRSQTFHVSQRLLLEAGVFPKITMEIDHLEAVVEMVGVGLGAAIVPRWAVGAENGHGAIAALSIGKSGIYRSWALAFVDRPQRPQMFRAFVRLCGERLPPMLSG